MTTQEALKRWWSVLEAAKEGRVVQFAVLPYGQWVDVADTSQLLGRLHYEDMAFRIKPREPRRIRFVVRNLGHKVETDDAFLEGESVEFVELVKDEETK